MNRLLILVFFGGLQIGCQSGGVEAVGESKESNTNSEFLESRLRVEIHDDALPVLYFGIDNEGDAAVCFPSFWFPTPGWPANDRYRIIDLDTGTEILPSGRLLHREELWSDIMMLPPRGYLAFADNLSPGFEFKSGHRYEVSYFIEGFLCTAYDEGFPAPLRPGVEESLIELEGARFFERTNENTVQIEVTTQFSLKP